MIKIIKLNFEIKTNRGYKQSNHLTQYLIKARLIGITLIMIGCLSFNDSVIFSPKKEAREVLVLAEFLEDSLTSVIGVI